MHTLMVLYPEPDNREAFARYYESTHLPLCARLPGAQQITYALGLAEPGSGPYYGVFTAQFADGEALAAALASPQGQAVEADVPNYATGGATVLTFPSTTLPLH